jgi:hypothetical protein
MSDIAGNRNRNQIEAADAAVGRIERDPAGAGDVDFRPGMGRSGPFRTQPVALGVEKVPRNHARAETQAANRLDEQRREIPAGAGSQIEGLQR